MKTIRDFDLNGKKVLIRADLDVPLKDGNIVDDFRIRKAIPTLRYALGQAEQVIIMGHLDRPAGKPDPAKSLKPVGERLQELLGCQVQLVEDYPGKKLPDNKVILLENLRFHHEEKANDEKFAEALAQYADIYVNEAFAVSHRAHASVVGVPKHLPGAVGFQFEQEVRNLSLDNAERPYIAIIGGAKLETKLPVIKKLLQKVDYLLLGGAMIFTFYKSNDWEVGNSLIQEEYTADARTLMGNKKLILPKDVVVADSTESEQGNVVPADNMPEEKIGLDIGPETIKEFKELLQKARTIVWNGPLGYNENPAFANATNEIARFLAETDSKTIIGGGDTASVIHKLGLEDEYNHVSTGGGASLKLLEGTPLPALESLED